ncbi:MAG: MoaD/ThiS family protein [Planctomycetaceae bacterium]|nr:MoaD/ThiS family protein [Planctomycetaceae bacterium]
MKMTVKLFAMVREIVGFDEITISISRHPPTVADLREKLLEQYPGLESLLPFSQVAVNHEVAVDSQQITVGDEVAILPPFSGG